MIEKININEKLSLFDDYWNPRVVGELNAQYVKLAKLKGEFVWHKHDDEDELFYVLKGALEMEFRDKRIEIRENEMIIVPRGIEHRSIALNEVAVMLFEPKTTINTGNTVNEMTRKNLDQI